MWIKKQCILLGLIFVVVVGMPSWGAQVAQQTEQPPLQPDLPNPVVAPETPSPPPAKPGTLTLENRADIFMARKDYVDAVEHYRRALQEGDVGMGGCGISLGSLTSRCRT